VILALISGILSEREQIAARKAIRITGYGIETLKIVRKFCRFLAQYTAGNGFVGCRTEIQRWYWSYSDNSVLSTYGTL